MRILPLLLMLISLSLTACSSSPARVENHASDLEVLKLGVETLSEPRQPAGDIQRLEDAKTSGQAFRYAMDLEDALYLSNEDKARTARFVQKATAAIIASRDPSCHFWQLACKRARYQAPAPPNKR